MNVILVIEVQIFYEDILELTEAIAHSFALEISDVELLHLDAFSNGILAKS